MCCIVRTILTFVFLINSNIDCFESFDESAWTDRKGKDNFFDYKELKEITDEIKDEIKTFSNNIDFELFGQKSSEVKPTKVYKVPTVALKFFKC